VGVTGGYGYGDGDGNGYGDGDGNGDGDGYGDGYGYGDGDGYGKPWENASFVWLGGGWSIECNGDTWRVMDESGYVDHAGSRDDVLGCLPEPLFEAAGWAVLAIEREAA
jgi:hypothetical protein